MLRREFIVGLGSAAAWPLAVRAQRGDRVRRIGVLYPGAESGPDAQERLNAFRQALEKLGWVEGRNVRFDTRFAVSNADQFQPLARELIALQPDVVLTIGSVITAALARESRTIPIVFVLVSDPIGAGLVASQARPGRNVHRISASRGRYCRQMDRHAQGDRAAGRSRRHDRQSEDSQL
jgi:putative ABC transport system substrate-binding protein